VVLIIGILLSISLPILIDLLDRSKTTRVLPYAKISMEHLAGYHSIYGDWPNSLANPFKPPGETDPLQISRLVLGQWPAGMSGIENQPVWIEGGVATHNGSFLLTSNVIDRNTMHTMAFYLRPVMHNNVPTNFVWECASRSRERLSLPDPTTVRKGALPTVCQSPKSISSNE